jgi:hypothetical protein
MVFASEPFDRQEVVAGRSANRALKLGGAEASPERVIQRAWIMSECER